MHVDYVLRAVSHNLFYLIKQIRSMSLNMVSLNQIYNALVLSRIQYALPAYYGFLLQADKDRIGALMRKASMYLLNLLTQHYTDSIDAVGHGLLYTKANSSYLVSLDERCRRCHFRHVTDLRA